MDQYRWPEGVLYNRVERIPPQEDAPEDQGKGVFIRREVRPAGWDLSWDIIRY